MLSQRGCQLLDNQGFSVQQLPQVKGYKQDSKIKKSISFFNYQNNLNKMIRHKNLRRLFKLTWMISNCPKNSYINMEAKKRMKINHIRIVQKNV